MKIPDNDSILILNNNKQQQIRCWIPWNKLRNLGVMDQKKTKFYENALVTVEVLQYEALPSSTTFEE